VFERERERERENTVDCAMSDDQPTPAAAAAEAAATTEGAELTLPSNGTVPSEGDGDETAKAAEIARKKIEDTADLTKRLQKLALERQKESSASRLKVIQSDTTSHLSSVKSFEELNLPKYLLDAVFAMGFDRPSAIQEEALPRILANPPRNLIGQAQSGSGKTAAFTLGSLYRINVDTPATTQALIVTPTRELATQIVENAVKPMAANMKGLQIETAIAGATIERGSKLSAHIVVGTPGKIIEWLKRKVLLTHQMKVCVFDEADNMVSEDGHRANSLLIKRALPTKCQTLLFSATFPSDVVAFADKMVANPDKILIEHGPEFLVRSKGLLWTLTCLYADERLLVFWCRWLKSLNNCGLTRDPTREGRGRSLKTSIA
jgi:ATP-dependent RNA helicase DDX19/DBP5